MDFNVGNSFGERVEKVKRATTQAISPLPVSVTENYQLSNHV